MRKLCKECPIYEDCNTTCEESILFEKQDNSKNYRTEPYVSSKEENKPPYVDARQSGGLNKFM